MDFLEEKVFDREQYDTYIRRIHYDDRDAVMYEKMIHFFFPYIVEERGIEDRVGIILIFAGRISLLCCCWQVS